MAYLEIDPERLSPADRAVLQPILRSEAARLERESDEARQRIAEWDDQDAAAGLEAEVRKSGEHAATVAALAKQRSGEALRNVGEHVIRSAATGISEQVRTAEEGLALTAFRHAGEWADLERRMTAQASVHEPEIYSRHSPHSFFLDLAARLDPMSPQHRAAVDRLERYGKALARDPGKEGLRARKIWREATRLEAGFEERSNANYRAMSTGSSSGGALVTPLYIVEDYAIFRSASPTFTNYLTTPRPLPAYGMTVDVPKFTGGGTVAAEVENVAPTETDPTAGYQTQPVAMYAGVVSASQQLHDRSGPLDFDTALYAQLQSQLDAAVDSAVITLALSGATAIGRTTSTTLTLAQFLADVGKASAALQTTAGTRLPPSGIAAAATISEWLLAQVTPNGDAWFKPSLGGTRTDDGVTGQAVSGIGHFIDDNIPAASGNGQLVVANKSALFVYSGAPVLDVYQEGGLAGSLGVTYRLRRYAVPIARFPAGVAVISGTGYPASPTFA